MSPGEPHCIGLCSGHLLRASPDLPFVGAAPHHTPRLPPLLFGLTPIGKCLDKRIMYDFERLPSVSMDRQKGVDNGLHNGILRNQVAQFSMHIWLKV